MDVSHEIVSCCVAFTPHSRSSRVKIADMRSPAFSPATCARARPTDCRALAAPRTDVHTTPHAESAAPTIGASTTQRWSPRRRSRPRCVPVRWIVRARQHPRSQLLCSPSSRHAQPPVYASTVAGCGCQGGGGKGGGDVIKAARGGAVLTPATAAVTVAAAAAAATADQ